MVDFVVIVVDDKLSQYQIRGLKSYRLYNASIALMSRTHLGVPATPITVRTMEAGVLMKARVGDGFWNSLVIETQISEMN